MFLVLMDHILIYTFKKQFKYFNRYKQQKGPHKGGSDGSMVLKLKLSRRRGVHVNNYFKIGAWI